ncbi:MAG: DNA polymerase III subunit beta [Holosporales bacterium]|jgi:DNA polymerase-3 subunit beta|nr:DNA polymerase III subunit beta [Holosporales bacterium]
MHFSLARAPFLVAVTSAHGVVDRRPAVPVLSHVLLEAAGDQITLRATDLDHAFVARIPAAVDIPGTAIVLAQTLYDALRKVNNDNTVHLSIDEEGKTLVLKAGRSRFSLTLLKDVDFPEEGAFAAGTTFSLPSSTLRLLLDKTRFAISTEETRYALNGVYLHTSSEGDALCAVATDGHRMAVVSVPFSAPAPFSLILARKTVVETLKLLEKEEGECTVSLSAAQIRLDFGDRVLTGRLVEGEFPKYARAVPERSESFFDINRRAFIEGVDRISVISSEEIVRVVRLKLCDNLLQLSSVRHEFGAAEEELDVVCPSAISWEAGFNGRYLGDAAEHVDGETVRVYLTDALAPIRLESPEKENISFVVMPMRV